LLLSDPPNDQRNLGEWNTSALSWTLFQFGAPATAISNNEWLRD